jgi:hypothetical protein
MRNLFIPIAAFVAILALSSCETDTIPESSISVRRQDNNQLISTTKTPGSITMSEGETLNFKVERLTSNEDGTETSDVTTVVKYVFIPTGIATANNLGVLTATDDGTTRMEVKFQPTSLDGIDRCFVDIRVNPVAAP